MEKPNDATEGFNDWEQIQAPPSAAAAQHGGAAVTIIDDYIRNNCSVFHPRNHEGLPVTTSPPADDSPRAQETPSFSSDSSSNEGEGVGPVRKRLGSGLGVLSSWVVRVGYGVRNCGGRGGAFWSFAWLSGVLAALVMYGKVRRWRWRRRFSRRESQEGLMLLLREKDKQISQLLLQIAQMNEMLSARRIVPVIRVGPLIVS